MLATGIITTVRWPHKLAFIRVRSDLYQVAAEKEGEHLARRAKEQHRRVRRLASHRVKFPVDELIMRMRELSTGVPKGSSDKQDPDADREDSDSADDFAEAATSKRVDHTSANPCYTAYSSSKLV